MSTIRALIIDDEVNNCINLQNILGRYCPKVEVLAMGHNAMEGLELIQKHQPDLLFLDIQMPGGSGFDLLEAIPKPNFRVIFVTAFDEYAIKALRISAIDYLLKPINILELQSAVSRASKEQINRENQAISNYITNASGETAERKIALPTAERIVYVRINEIVRFQGESNYTHVYLMNGQHILVSRTLKEYEEMLSESSFLRTHQSHLVNQKHVNSYEKQDGGYLKMTDGSQVSISRQRKDKVLKALAS